MQLTAFFHQLPVFPPDSHLPFSANDADVYTCCMTAQQAAADKQAQ